VGGTYYVQTLTLTPLVLLAAAPVGALITNILVVNNYRDIETDAKAGKRTLAVMMGRRGARMEYLLLLIVAYLIPLLLWLGFGWTPWVMLPWLTLPLAVPLVRTVFTSTDGPTLNITLAGTARLSLFFGLLFALGIAVG
jgi:1,4-dihydroxy-2-naphthoate octaprenyltransferase